MRTWRDGLARVPFAYRALPQGGEWTTREGAAFCLGIGEFDLNLLMASTHWVDVVRTADGEVAVTRVGVEAEKLKLWRATAPCRRKVLRLLKDTALSF
ncbi:hypothetical protein [Kitasatospora sp. CB02891]|uniref:hypothetical protein n=1 Tax=Kitasatospora sp. CB02891 TaxID=2020329 RepID=UPI000C273660|nr:hypothetical protein [Kitasatospora sp. CB02891]PJN21087.1 hypothetical protein CG736_35115 [Kitasatospora sp. CB02891]